VITVPRPLAPPEGAAVRPAALVAAFATQLRVYRRAPTALLVHGVFYLMVTAVLSGLWRVAVAATGGTMAGYDPTAIVWYIATTEAAILGVRPRLIEDEGEEITSGRIELDLLRPAAVFPLKYAAQLGETAPKLACSIVLGVTWARLFGGAPANGGALAMAGLALVLAVLVNIAAQLATATLSFWLRDVKSTWFLYQKLIFVLGGMLLPLEVLPSAVEAVAKALPFMAMAYVPGRLAAGHTEWSLIGLQVLWLMVMGAVAAIGYRAGPARMVRH
jgi:ABC-2 type transport system permease protein